MHWKQPLDRHRKGKADILRLLRKKKRVVSGCQGDKEEAGRVVRSCPGPQTTAAHRRPQPRPETKKYPVLNKQAKTKSQKKMVKEKTDNAQSCWVQLGRLQMPDWVIVLHPCAATPGFSGREKIEFCAALFCNPISFSMGCFLSFTKESQNKGIYAEDLKL